MIFGIRQFFVLSFLLLISNSLLAAFPFDTFAAFKPRPLGRGTIRPLSVNPEQAPGFSPGTVEWVDHTYRDWQKFLDTYLKDGLVDYKTLKQSPNALEMVMSHIERISLQEYTPWTPKQKMAFWVNAYNIAAIKVVVDHYPLKRSKPLGRILFPENSIQQIPNVWKRDVISIFGKPASLNHIEHNTLRREFEDPRIHFAIVCASLGCPSLRPEAYVAEKLDEQLDNQVFLFLSDAEKFRYEPSNDTLYLSPIFKWFKKDFDKRGGIIAFLKSYLQPEIKDKVTIKTKIRWLDYDWHLNEQG